MKYLNLTKHQEKLSNLEQQSLFDLKNYLKDDLLVKVDRHFNAKRFRTKSTIIRP